MDIKIGRRHPGDHGGGAGAGAKPAGCTFSARCWRRCLSRAPTISTYAPRIYTMKINPTDKIGELIGPGGKMIRGIIEQTGVKIDVEDDGTREHRRHRRAVRRQGARR